MRGLRVLMSFALTIAVAPAAFAQTRVEEVAPATVVYTGGWIHRDTSRAWSAGTASYSVWAGSRATLIFSGTGASWIGFKGPQMGIANVYLDGVLQGSVDTCAPTEEMQAALFTATGLPSGLHSLTIEVTGTTTCADGAWVVVDAFDVGSSAGVRVEENSPSVDYSGYWLHGDASRAWSGGAAAASNQGPPVDTKATLSFNGTEVSWIGYKGPQGGIANVYVDEVLQASVDTCAQTEQPQVALFTASGLASGAHTLTVEVTGNTTCPTDPLGGSWIVVDAFDLAP